ncbi:protein phosphatase 1 regulatory subunit 32 [Hypomesus transpacificus]|uniref:protein phosphatase 1 regulatory subunit 32 n=1 Tax=Hypomesus transpacificus TaxID=137520 RepID=UPI001F086FC8|nr:protein phosphatase 1 regulatory subunit 32 [Hypomesus transpacificus]
MGGQVEIARLSLGGTGSPRGRLTNNSLNLYCTSYKDSYDKEGFVPTLGCSHGTGYSANLRPAVSYNPSLDHTDNPQLGRSLLNSFQSQTKRHFKPFIGLTGCEAVPCPSGKVRESGYLQHMTHPKQNAFLQTEYEKCFVPHRPQRSVSQKHLIVGFKEESGFTEAVDLQLNTFLPHNCYMDDPRKTKQSVMKTDFVPITFLQGSDALPRLIKRAQRETAFTRDTLDPLACPASLLPSSRTPKASSPTQMKSFGTKEPTGFLLNPPNLTTLPLTLRDSSRFLTHYQSKFCDVSALRNQRTGWMTGGIQKRRSDGYTGRDTDRFNLWG